MSTSWSPTPECGLCCFPYLFSLRMQKCKMATRPLSLFMSVRSMIACWRLSTPLHFTPLHSSPHSHSHSPFQSLRPEHVQGGAHSGCCFAGSVYRLRRTCVYGLLPLRSCINKSGQCIWIFSRSRSNSHSRRRRRRQPNDHIVMNQSAERPSHFPASSSRSRRLMPIDPPPSIPTSQAVG